MSLSNQKIKQRREELGLTQKEVAQAINRSQGRLSQCENSGESLGLSYSETLTLAELLQCRPEDLMDD